MDQRRLDHKHVLLFTIFADGQRAISLLSDSTYTIFDFPSNWIA